MTAKTLQTTPWIPSREDSGARAALDLRWYFSASLWARGSSIVSCFAGLTETRHRSLRQNFKRPGPAYDDRGAACYLAFNAMSLTAASDDGDLPVDRVIAYLELGALIWSAIVFIKVTRILVFEYLYLSHMTVEFPLLLVNMFTLLLSIAVATWFAAEIFGVRLTPLLATSAVFSLVLGLALQDTLGNLFSGIALQFDPPLYDRRLGRGPGRDSQVDRTGLKKRSAGERLCSLGSTTSS